jgi:hypothetical protein
VIGISIFMLVPPMHNWTFWLNMISIEILNIDTRSCSLTPPLLLQQITVWSQLTSAFSQVWPPLSDGLQQYGVPEEHWLIWVTGLWPWPGHPGIGGGGGKPRGSSELSAAIGLAMPPVSKDEKKQRMWITLKCILDNDKRSYLDSEKPTEVNEEIVDRYKLMSSGTLATVHFARWESSI